MGRKIRINKAKEQLTEAEWDFLTDNYDSNDRSDQDRWWQIFMLEYDNKGNVEALWNAHRDTILIEHAKENPGTRPALFWQFDAPRSPLGTYKGAGYDGELPEPRLRLGGVGTVASDVLNYKPCFSYGIPLLWICQSDCDYYNRVGLFAHVAPNPNSAGPFTGVAIDPNDPPLYESTASYLDRIGLFLPGEKTRLKAKDFMPETICYVDGE